MTPFDRAGNIDGHAWMIELLPADRAEWEPRFRVVPAAKWVLRVLYRDGEEECGVAATVAELRDVMLPFAIQQWERRQAEGGTHG